MSTDIPDLMQQIYDHFLTMFHQTTGTATDVTFLAFQEPGTAWTPEMYAPPPGTAVSPQTVAREVFSNLANIVPALDADEFKPTGKTIDGFYEFMLLGSQFDPRGGNDQLFVTMKSQAKEAFDKGALGSILQGIAIPFHPAYSTPDNWYDPVVTANWPSYSVSSGTPPPPPPPSDQAPPVRPHFTERPWGWRVAEQDGPPRSTGFGGGGVQVHQGPPRALESASPGGEPPTGEPLSYGAMLTALVLERYAPPAGDAAAQDPGAFEAAPVVRDHRHGATDAPVVRDHRTGVPPAASGLQAILAAGTLNATLTAAPPQPVESHSLTLSFQYSLMKVDRPWLSQQFLFTRDWYMPGYKVGEFSSGTEANRGGIFPALPIACLVIKDLKITADATEISTMAGQSGAFGPFVLGGSTLDTTRTTLTVPGLQIIGWVCQMLPVLPPLGAPMVVNVPNAGLYSQPGVAQPILTLLAQGTSVVPTAEEITVGDTVLIKVRAGTQTGWINKQFLS